MSFFVTKEGKQNLKVECELIFKAPTKKRWFGLFDSSCIRRHPRYPDLWAKTLKRSVFP